LSATEFDFSQSGGLESCRRKTGFECGAVTSNSSRTVHKESKMYELRLKEPEYSLVSTSTILILSGFLLGVSFAQPSVDYSYYIFTCGVTGLIAFMTFQISGIRKEQAELRDDQRLMEARLVRHLSTNLQGTQQNQGEKDRLLEWLRRETEVLSS